MSGSTSDILGIPWDRETGDGAPPSDHNLLARIDENTLAKVLLNLIFERGLVNRSPNVCVVDDDNGRIEAPPSGDPIVGLIRGRAFYMGTDLELTGTATGGDTTYLDSNDFTEIDDFWNDAYVIFTSGANDGVATQITDYDLSSGRITFDAVGTAVAADVTFIVTFFYVQSLTSGVQNWIFGRATGRTTRDGLIQWVASTSSTKAEGDILVATVTLDLAGGVVSSDNEPTDHDRNLWTGAGAVHKIEFSGTLGPLLAGAYTDVEVTHDELILLGSIKALVVVPSTCTITPIEYWDGETLTLRIQNDGSYASSVSYSGQRWGRKKVRL